MKRRKGLAALMAAAMLAGSLTAVPAAAEEKDTLIMMDDSTNLSMDPDASNGASGLVMCQLYDTLFQYDEEGNLVPALAESWEEKEDGTGYTVHLRQDVTFTDGTPFNADAVLFCYERILESPAKGSAMAASIKSMVKTDDYTLEIEKMAPYSKCLELCATVFFLYSPTAYEADPDAFATTSPVGCGPYVLDEWDTTTGTIYMSANESYYAGAPAIKKLEIRTTMDSSTALVALETGELDIMFNCSGNDVELAEAAGLTVNSDYVGYSIDTMLMYGEPYVSDDNLRTAISYAVNQENAALLSGYDADAACTEIAGSLVMGEYEGQAPMHSYDPEKAAEYLAQSSYAGETLELNVLSDYENEAVSIQADLAAIGINAQVNILDGGTWYEKIVDGTVQMTIVGIGGAYSSVQETLQYFAADGRYGALGSMAYSDEMNALCAELQETWDTEELYEKTIQALQLAAEDAAVVPLCQAVVNKVYNSALQGYNTFNSYRVASCSFE